MHAHTHTQFIHVYIHIYLYIRVCVCVCMYKEKGDVRQEEKNEDWKGFFREEHESFCEGEGALFHRLTATSSGMWEETHQKNMDTVLLGLPS